MTIPTLEPTITAHERIYREMKAVREPIASSPPPSAPAPEIKLTRLDLEAILRKRRGVTLAEIEWFLGHSKDYRILLTNVEENELRSLAIKLCVEARNATTRRTASEEFLVRNVGVYATPYGDLNESEVRQLNTIHLAASRSIQVCDHHQRERCDCWRDARERLYELRQSDRSAVSTAALAVWNSIESIARSAKRDTQPLTEPEIQAGFTPFNWRHYKSDPQYAPPI